MSTYSPLGDYLDSSDETEITLSFRKIEDILGRCLPRSARDYRPWWANDATHTQARHGWLDVGWTVSTLNPHAGTVTFHRG